MSSLDDDESGAGEIFGRARNFGEPSSRRVFSREAIFMRARVFRWIR